MCTDCIKKLDDTLQLYFRKILSTIDTAIEEALPKVHQK